MENLTGAKALVAAFDKNEKAGRKPTAKGKKGGGKSPAAKPPRETASRNRSAMSGRPSNKRKAEEEEEAAAAAAAASQSPAKKKRGPGRPKKSPVAVEQEDGSGSESDTYNLSQETDYGSASHSQRQAAADRGIDSRSSGRLKTLKHELSGAQFPSIFTLFCSTFTPLLTQFSLELSGDVKTAGKVMSGAASKKDAAVKEKRWSRALDSKLLAVVAGKKKVTAGHWSEAAAATGRTVEGCRARHTWLQQQGQQ